MRIVVFGATGNTGRQVIQQALASGHEVTAFVRDAGALAMSHERLRVCTGDTTGEAEPVGAAIDGQDVVVSALGRRATFRSDNLIARSVAAIVPAMQRAGVRRIFVVSAFGVGHTRADAPLVPRIMHRLLLGDIFADKHVADEALRATDLDWTIVYPTLLTDGPVTGRYRAAERLDLSGMPKVSRADVAHFIVSHLQGDAWLRKGVVISA